jgi:hypothetical protein
MARHYSPSSFFRQVPNALLARYFGDKGLFDELDFGAMKETRTDDLDAAWQALQEDERKKHEPEMLEIFNMSCRKGTLAIIDAARQELKGDPAGQDAFVSALAGLPNHYHRAMTTFLDHPAFWKRATRYYHADTLSWWRKRGHMGHAPAITDQASRDALAKQISHYFHHAEGRGKNCLVEALRRGDRDYIFAYPEDYSQQSVEWVDGEFDRRPHNPAFEVVFLYSQKDGTLDLNYRGTKKAVRPLQGMFATTILKLDELPPEPKDNRVYDLDPLGKRTFNFNYSINDGIEFVAIRKMRLSDRYGQHRRFTLETNTEDNDKAIYDLLDSLRTPFPINRYHVTWVEILAKVKVHPDKPARKVPIQIRHPNSCSLKYDELDMKLRRMLEASGIELKPPKDEKPSKAENE